MNKKIIIIMVVLAALLAVFIVWNKFYMEKTLIATNKQCTADSDCVKAACCHAKEAVGKDYAPDCADIFCTQECVPDTLDCGQGEIKCVGGACEVVLK